MTHHETTTPGTTVPPPRRRARPVVRALATGVGLLLVAGVTTEAIAARRDAARWPVPGELVQLDDGRQLHVQTANPDAAGPTVVLEAGAGLPSFLFDDLTAALGDDLPVLAYDRAGSGYSDGHPRAGSLEQVTADLHELLAEVELPGPYLLVGHSIGGHYARAYAAGHPGEVAGLVLLDPRHEQLSARMPELVEQTVATETMARWGARLQPLGIVRAVHPTSDQLDPSLADRLRTVELRRPSLAGVAQLLGQLDELDRQIAARPLPAEVPTLVVSAGSYPADEPAQQLADVLDGLHADLAATSDTAERLVVADADHLSVLFQPYTNEIADHVRRLAGRTANR
jgi:pimeloyl-ACP methyl ester carboxylesterase